MTPALSPAQSAEIVWQENDKKHRGWTVHLHVGSEVIKYHLSPGQGAADSELIPLAVKAAEDDGYELDAASVRVKR